MQFSNILAASAVLAFTDAAALTSRATAGKATFYGGNVNGGTCSFTGYTIPSGLYGVAMNSPSWDGSGACGACVSVTGPRGNKITVQVVDKCPECTAEHLDLFQNAFATLDDISKGIIPITWEYVNCPITSPLRVRNKEGTSQWWFSMQVINANKRVQKLDFSTNGGSTWTATTRKDYNYFEYPSGSGTNAVDVRITSIAGDVIIIKNVSIGAGVSVTAASNFGLNSANVEETSNSAAKDSVQEPETPVEQPPASVSSPVPAVVVKPVNAASPVPEVAQPAVPQVLVESKPAATTPAEAVKPVVDVPKPVEQKQEVNAEVKPATLPSPTTPIKLSTPMVPPAQLAATTPTPTVVTVTITGCPTSTPA